MNTSTEKEKMIAQKMTLTHFSLVGFDGTSQLWNNWDNFPFLTVPRDPRNGSHRPEVFKGSIWHIALDAHHFSKDSTQKRKPEIKVRSSFIGGDLADIRYGDVEYVGHVNFGFDQSVLAFSIIGIKGSKVSPNIFTNSVKLYTNWLTTRGFLERNEPLLVKKADKRIFETGGIYYPHAYV